MEAAIKKCYGDASTLVEIGDMLQDSFDISIVCITPSIHKICPNIV
jgi:hypothetical protein